MRKFILTIGLAFGIMSAAKADSWLVTNLNNTAVSVATNYALLSGSFRIKTLQIQTANAVTAKFYDSSTSATNYVTSANVTVGSYATNLVQNVVTTTGVTNYMTNSYSYVYYLTNAAATNALPTIYTAVVPASTTTGILTVGANVSKGLSAYISTTNVTVIINYDRLY